jgi:hypothetical protein
LKEVLVEAPHAKRGREEIVGALFASLSVGFLRVGRVVDADPAVSSGPKRGGRMVRPSGQRKGE